MLTTITDRHCLSKMCLSRLLKPIMRNIIVSSLLLLAFMAQAEARDEQSNAVISIIIDDIGYRLREDLRAIGIPGPLTYAIMPHSPHAVKMSALAHKHGKDVIVHMPMEAVEEKKNRFLGPGALTLDMTTKEFESTFNSNLSSVPHAIGVNNHMGSLLTQHPGHMQWLMQALSQHGKFYLDSMTSQHSVANMIARENSVPYLRRDIFLDNNQSTRYIENQFDALIKLAKYKGTAIAIGHPHQATIEVLLEKLQTLEKSGVRLVSLPEMMNYQNKSRSNINVSWSGEK